MQPVSVLLVDSNLVFLRIATGLLQEYYCNELIIVGTSNDGEDVLSQARTLQPDILLLGTGLNSMHYLQIIPEVQATLPQVKIIVLGFLDTKGYRQVALAAGADEFVLKIAINTDLLPAIQRVRCST
jgi:DNA-binding NarL/FixJ family response regulator